jgi:branched-subunit amino acid permease
MRKVFAVLHALAVLAVLAICLLAAVDSVSYYGHEPFAFSYERNAVALLCGSFAVAHLYLVATKRITVSVALVFYPLCVLLGLATALVTRASAKGWAPGTTSEALVANAIGYGLVAVLVAASAASCYWAFASGRRNSA